MNWKSVFTWLWSLFIFGLPFTGYSYASEEITRFIETATGKTFDCPEQKVIDQVENYLSLEGLNLGQLRGLQSLKSHHLICLGDYEGARKLISLVVNSEAVDKNSHYFAMAHYQLGFIYDVQGNSKKCEQYERAEQFGEGKFDDIYLSARLGQITECADNKEELGLNLGSLYALLESYTAKNDPASVAHIHNNIGLLYGRIGQSALAAEQYEKAYKIGLEVYEPKNQIAPLMSVINASISIGEYEKTMNMIEELGKARVKLNTPLIHNWYYYSLARYFYMKADFLALKSSLENWADYIDQVSSRSLRDLFDWYSAKVCLYEKNRACVQSFITEFNAKDTSQRTRSSKHREFLRFLVEANFFLGDATATEKVFSRYADGMHEKIRFQQASARVLGVAQLHRDIILLEADLQAAEHRRVASIAMVLGIALSVLLLIYFVGFRPYLRRLNLDPLTGLLNEQSVMQQIKSVKAPIAGRVNALAMFDLGKCIEANMSLASIGLGVLIKRVAICLQDVTREHDIAGRLGADQFLVCLRNIEEQKATELFGRIQNALSNIIVTAENTQKIDVNSCIHVYSSLNDLSDVDSVLAEIRNVLRKA